MRRVSLPFSRASCWSPRFRSRWPRTPPARTPRSRLCARATSRSRDGRTPPRSSSTRSRRSWSRRAARPRASRARQAVVERGSRRRAQAARDRTQRSHVSESRLAELVRALYEQPGQADPLAILLGAAVARGSADGPRQSQPRGGREQQDHRAGACFAKAPTRRSTRGSPHVRRSSHSSRAAAAARARSLADAAETRKRFVAGLRHQQGLNAARIASIEAQARSAEARTTAIATTTAPVTTAVSATASRRVAGRSPSAPPATPCAAAPPPASRRPPESSPSTRR